MNNPHKGEVPFVVGDKTYTLRYSVDAICAMEGQRGCGIIAMTDDLRDPKKMSITLVREMLWAGLHEHHPELTVKEVGELIPEAGGVLHVIATMQRAFATAFPQPKEGDARPTKAGSPANGIGQRSSSIGVASAGTTKRSGERRPGKSG